MVEKEPEPFWYHAFFLLGKASVSWFLHFCCFSTHATVIHPCTIYLAQPHFELISFTPEILDIIKRSAMMILSRLQLHSASTSLAACIHTQIDFRDNYPHVSHAQNTLAPGRMAAQGCCTMDVITSVLTFCLLSGTGHP